MLLAAAFHRAKSPFAQTKNGGRRIASCRHRF
jgi:hypothetical protein